MAGDNHESSATEVRIPPEAESDPFPSIAATLSGILAALTGVGSEVIGAFTSSASATFTVDSLGTISQHMRFRVGRIVASTDTACILSLTVGTHAYQFALAPGVADWEFPIVFERGVDMIVSSSVATTARVYLVGQPE